LHNQYQLGNTKSVRAASQGSDANGHFSNVGAAQASAGILGNYDNACHERQPRKRFPKHQSATEYSATRRETSQISDVVLGAR